MLELTHSGSLTASRLPRLCAGLSLLAEAQADSENLEYGRWEFAVSLQELLLSGLRGTDLRWLVSQGLLETAVEQIRNHRGHRYFLPSPDRTLTDNSCFVLTDQGRQFAKEFLAIYPANLPAAITEPKTKALPLWDASSRELLWKEQIVKRFRTPAECQELILSVFQEEGWPPRIDDPLIGVTRRGGRDRLHDVVRSLNRNQRQARIRFGRDGKGEGVCWCEPECR
jgi:hypothetical protein